MQINSANYWDRQFKEQGLWEETGGRARSAFFADVALMLMPSWLKEDVQQHSLSLCDWGCALGDGTEYLASALAVDCTGLDFSDSAIQRAKASYPRIRFLRYDIDTDRLPRQWDVVFTSNTLQLFSEPWEKAAKLTRLAKSVLVILVPFEEMKRSSEHQYTFDISNIPMKLGQFSLWSARWADTSELVSTEWMGKQLMLVYGAPDYAPVTTLTLSRFADSSVALRLATQKRDLADVVTSSQSDSAPKGEASYDVADLSCINAVLTRESGGLADDSRDAGHGAEDVEFDQNEVNDTGQRLSLIQTSVAERIRTLEATNELIQIKYEGAHRAYLEEKRRSEEHLARIAALMDSRSWRLSAPLRTLGNLVKRFKYKEQAVRHSANYVDLEAFVRQHQRVLITNSGFAFDATNNQTSIALAEAAAEAGYGVIFVGWEWDSSNPDRQMRRRLGPNLFQVSRFDLAIVTSTLRAVGNGSYILLVTVPSVEVTMQLQAFKGLGTRIIYHVLDDWEEFDLVGQAPWYEKKLEQHILLNSDKVTVVAPGLKDMLAEYGAVWVGNGYRPIETSQKPVQTAKSPKKVGYFGHLIEAWFDWNLVFALASAMPDLTIEIVGDGHSPETAIKAAQFPNITLFGRRPKHELATIARTWSIGLIPFKPTRLSNGVDPLKVYEYLELSLPVLSTGIPHLSTYPNCLNVEDSESFVQVVRALLDKPIAWEDAVEFLQTATWDRRLSQVLI